MISKIMDAKTTQRHKGGIYNFTDILHEGFDAKMTYRPYELHRF
jgi:hypothetical protein